MKREKKEKLQLLNIRTIPGAPGQCRSRQILDKVWRFVQSLSMSRNCPLHVQLLTKLCLYLIFVHVLSPKSNLCPIFVQAMNPNFSENCWTDPGQILYKHIFSFTTWSPCMWTKNGQTLDLGCWTNFRQS